MNVLLWILQCLLAILFFATGLMKTIQPIDRLADKMGWVHDASPFAVRTAGVAEILASLSLLFPAMFGVVEILTPMAAIGLGQIMVLAIPLHVRRDELGMVGLNVLLLALLGVIAAGRLMEGSAG